MKISMYRSILLLLINGFIDCLCPNLASVFSELYVVPFQSLIDDSSDGSLIHPYLSLQQALDHIERDYGCNTIFRRSITINLYPTYHFVKTARLTQAHSHTRLITMSAETTAFYDRMIASKHRFRHLTKAVLSGGVPITNWTQISGNTYSTVVPSLSFVNQLFVDDQRIVRTRVPMNHSDYLQYAAPLTDSHQAHYGFQYVSGQFDYKSLTDAMVIVYHSWTESHHYIDRLITTNNTILFTNPSAHPIGEFVAQGQRRFHIENLCEALVPNSFCFVNETKTIYLMTDGSYDPTKSQIITSVNETVLSLASDDRNNPVEDIIIDNIAIQHGAWNVNRTEVAEAASASFLSSVALFIANATAIVISNVEISHTGSYGLRIKEGTSDVNVINSLITDTGAGGIWIGDRTSDMSMAPRSIKIISNEISYGGNVFPSGVGVLIHRAVDIAVVENTIHHHRYNGISVGQGGYTERSAINIIIQGNYVYNTGQHILCDQGGIYTLGVQRGTIITGNVVKNVFSYATSMYGIYLDDGSSDILVSNNVVYNTGWSSIFQHYGANNTVINNVFARASLLSQVHPGDPPADGDVYIQDAEKHTSWNYTRNIVYDTSKQAKHSAFNSRAGVIAFFSSNVYFNPYGTLLLFGSKQTLFDEWQKTGQDNGSIIADPLFAGDVNQCDFFTVQSDSPAAKLGFVNLTKLAQWTPGCQTDDETEERQFYHW